MCIQEEVRLRQEGNHTVMMVAQGAQKKKPKFEKGKKFPPKQNDGPGESSKGQKGKFAIKCYF